MNKYIVRKVGTLWGIFFEGRQVGGLFKTEESARARVARLLAFDAQSSRATHD